MDRRIHHIREVSESEETELRKLSSSRTHPYRTVQRAKLIVNMIDDETLTARKRTCSSASFRTVIIVIRLLTMVR